MFKFIPFGPLTWTFRRHPPVGETEGTLGGDIVEKSGDGLRDTVTCGRFSIPEAVL